MYLDIIVISLSLSLSLSLSHTHTHTHSQSMYEPGKRHWLKVKKDYLAGGSMADTADLLVLGAYYGTGNKGVLKSYILSLPLLLLSPHSP